MALDRPFAPTPGVSGSTPKTGFGIGSRTWETPRMRISAKGGYGEGGDDDGVGRAVCSVAW